MQQKIGGFGSGSLLWPPSNCGLPACLESGSAEITPFHFSINQVYPLCRLVSGRNTKQPIMVFGSQKVKIGVLFEPIKPVKKRRSGHLGTRKRCLNEYAFRVPLRNPRKFHDKSIIIYKREQCLSPGVIHQPGQSDHVVIPDHGQWEHGSICPPSNGVYPRVTVHRPPSRGSGLLGIP